MGKTKARTKRRSPTPPRVQHPKVKEKPPRRYAWVAWGAMVAVAAAGAFWLAKSQSEGPSEAVEPPVTGLPDTPDYHSLLVDLSDPEQLFLGTHVGLYESADGGRRWEFARLEGQDAMNLARATGETVWAAGHDVLAKSADGGESWSDVRPEGLPSLDVHGFAIDPRDPQHLYAAVAGQGLYRSSDGGTSFALLSGKVGGEVMALVATPDGRILAGDMRQGLLVSEDEGKTWRQTLAAGVMGLAMNPDDPRRILAGGPGILLSTDGGMSWRTSQEIGAGAGPVAWSPSNPKIAYAVGFDRLLYRTSDAGATWNVVG